MLVGRNGGEGLERRKAGGKEEGGFWHKSLLLFTFTIFIASPHATFICVAIFLPQQSDIFCGIICKMPRFTGHSIIQKFGRKQRNEHSGKKRSIEIYACI